MDLVLCVGVVSNVSVAIALVLYNEDSVKISTNNPRDGEVPIAL